MYVEYYSTKVWFIIIGNMKDIYNSRAILNYLDIKDFAP
jgi:hypothetical protein